jgi:hypothetical protein
MAEIHRKLTNEERQVYIDFREAFGSVHGLRVLENLKKTFHFYESPKPKGMDGHTDVYEVMRCEGKRAVITYILKKINTDLGETKQTAAKTI